MILALEVEFWMVVLEWAKASRSRYLVKRDYFK